MDCAVRAVSDDFIRALGVVLTKIVSDVVPEYGSLSCFNSINAPPISDYLVRIARYVNCSNECFVLALVYIDRIMKMHKFSVSVLNIHRLLITSVMLAAKFSDDVYYSNSFYAQVGGIKVAEMNILEAQFLMLIKYQLFVSAKDYENCRKGVESSSNKIYTIPLLSQNNTHKNTNTFNNKPKYSNDNRAYNSTDRLYNSSDRLYNSSDRLFNSNDRVFNSNNSYDSENRVFNSGNSGYNGNPIPNTSTYTGKVYNNSLFNGLKGYGSGYTNVKSLYDDLYSKLQLNKDNGRYNTADNKGKAYNPHSYYNTVGQNYNTLNYTLKQNNINQNTTNHNTLNQNTIHNTMNNTIRHNTLNKPVYNTINHNTVNHNTIAHNTVNHNTIAHNTNAHNTLRNTLGHVKSESLNVHGGGFNEYSGYDHGSTFKNDDEYLITSEKLSLSSYIYDYGADGFARTESTLTVSTSASDTQEVPDEAALRDRESFRTKFDECEAFVNALESRFNDTLQRKCSTHLGPVHQLALINLKNDWWHGILSINVVNEFRIYFKMNRPEERFNPYVNNGGTVIAATWNNYAVIAADTRLSQRYLIHTRFSTKLFKLTDKCILGTSGMQADMLALQSVLERQIELYRYTHNREPTFNAIAQLLSTVLYGRRFFPYYTFNILCGIDEQGKGVVCGYDAVGNYNYEKYTAQGTSSSLVISVLDNLLNGNNQKVKPEVNSLEDLVNLVKNAMVSAVERDICTGDSAELVICDGVVMEPVHMDLRID